MKLDDFFERIFIINLQFKGDRRHRLLEHFRKLNIVSTDRLVWYRAICGDWTPPPAWFGAGNGAWGCLMSHVRVAQDAVHDKLASYLVLEDDIVFHPRASEMFSAFIRELPSDWGQIYLGGQFLHREPIQISPFVLRPFNVNRTHAFAVAGPTIPLFLQHIMHAPDYFAAKTKEKGEIHFDPNCFHIDHQLGRAHERGDWNTYAPNWWIAGQDRGRSNISGQVNPRLWWHWRDRGHALPYFYITQGATAAERVLNRRFLHVGYNTVLDTLVDVGITKSLSDEELLTWLRLIAGEAIELWKLPGFEIPNGNPDLVERVRSLWKPGVFESRENALVNASDYPFNGLCGGFA